MKYLIWKGNSLQQVRLFPKGIKEDMGFQLDCLQQDLTPTLSQSISEIDHRAKSIMISNSTNYHLVYYEKNIESSSSKQLKFIKELNVNVVYILCAFSTIHKKSLNKNIKNARKVLQTIKTAWRISHE